MVPEISWAYLGCNQWKCMTFLGSMLSQNPQPDQKEKWNPTPYTLREKARITYNTEALPIGRRVAAERHLDFYFDHLVKKNICLWNVLLTKPAAIEDIGKTYSGKYNAPDPSHLRDLDIPIERRQPPSPTKLEKMRKALVEGKAAYDKNLVKRKAAQLDKEAELEGVHIKRPCNLIAIDDEVLDLPKFPPIPEDLALLFSDVSFGYGYIDSKNEDRRIVSLYSDDEDFKSEPTPAVLDVSVKLAEFACRGTPLYRKAWKELYASKFGDAAWDLAAPTMDRLH